MTSHDGSSSNPSVLDTVIGSTPEHEDPFSPYHLHHSENANSGVVTPLLDRHNYHTWSRAFLMSLSIQNKVGFIDGSLPKPTGDDTKIKSWMRNNTIIMSWLIHSVSNEIKSTVLYLSNAHEAWDKLKVRYAQPDDVRIFQLQQELSSIT